MKKPWIAAAVALFFAPVPALSGAGAPAESLRFAPAPGVLVRNLHIGHELTLEAMGQVRDGGPFQAERLSSWVSSWLKVTAEDQLLAVEGGRPTRFVRTYTDLGGGGKLTLRPEGSPKQREEDAVLVSPLRERSVDFQWVPEEGDWGRSWSRVHAEEEWLAEIHGDMDLLALLPAGEVAEGDTWDVPIEAVRSLLAPGGNHLITPRTPNVFSRTIEVGVGGDFSEVLGDQLAGRLTARLAGVANEQGVRLARVELRIEGLQSIRDRTELWRTSMPREERREEARLVSVLLEYSLDAEGELVWDLDAGHARSLQLSGRERFVSNLAKDLPVDGGLARIDAQATFGGTLSLSYDITPRAVESTPR